MIVAYKAFHQGLKGAQNYQYEIGKEYSSYNEGVGAHGFHAALDPVFCLTFIPPHRGGEYAEVQIDGAISRGGVTSRESRCGDNAVTGEVIRITRRLSVSEMLIRAVKYRTERATELDSLKNASESRFCAVSICGNKCAAIADADNSYAEASGANCLAVATGTDSEAYATGTDSVAAAIGTGCWAGGASFVVLSDWSNPSSLTYLHNPKTGFFYSLQDGVVVEKAR